MNQSHSLDTLYSKMDRRNFIKKSCSLTIFASTFTYHNIVAQTSPTEKLLSILNNRQSAVLIGLAVRDNIGYSLQSTDLLSLILSDINLTIADLNLISKASLANLLVQQNATDFDLNRIINAKGWMLGLTEARLCVLAAQYS